MPEESNDVTCTDSCICRVPAILQHYADIAFRIDNERLSSTNALTPDVMGKAQNQTRFSGSIEEFSRSHRYTFTCGGVVSLDRWFK
jgi:hypothetical protein